MQGTKVVQRIGVAAGNPGGRFIVRYCKFDAARIFMDDPQQVMRIGMLRPSAQYMPAGLFRIGPSPVPYGVEGTGQFRVGIVGSFVRHS
jgi:hypothetical protein